MLRNLLAIAVSSGLAAMALKLWIDRENKQRHGRAQGGQARAIQRWEDEGGKAAPTAESAEG